MRLYVWENVLEDYSSGIMFALAASVDDAREAICPQWNAAEAALKLPGADEDRPLPGYGIGTVHEDLRKEPDVYDSPKGFTVWGGG